MSPTKQFIAAGKKPTVAQTCNQLSLFLKQKGCLRDLHLGINAKSDNTARMTIDLLSNIENPDQNNSGGSATAAVAAAAAESKPMTIFYDGKVIVFDDIPADRARDLMLAAGGGDYPKPSGKTESTQPIDRVETNGLDLPIARRASLHKFLAKRKDRATVRAPYQLQNPSPVAGAFKHEHNFDLNL